MIKTIDVLKNEKAKLIITDSKNKKANILKEKVLRKEEKITKLHLEKILMKNILVANQMKLKHREDQQKVEVLQIKCQRSRGTNN